MKKIVKDIIRALLMGTGITLAFTFSLINLFQTSDGYTMIICIAIISTMCFCTNTILKELRSIKELLEK